MLGTFALDSNNGPILPSPKPIVRFDNVDPFAGGYKFCYFTINRIAESSDNLINKIRSFLSAKQSACLIVGRVLTERKAVDIGHISYPKCDPRAIIEEISFFAHSHSFEECYTDQKTFDWLSANNFWFSYCATRQEEIKDDKEIKNNYDLSLLKINRSIEESIRLSEFSTAYEDGRIGLVAKYYEDKPLVDSISKFENLILCDAIGGLLAASSRYR
jgi:hypothetical protein